MTDKEILTAIMLQHAYSMKHDLIASAYVNIGLKITKSQCIEDLWNFYEINNDRLQILCKMYDLDLDTVKIIYKVIYNGFCESKIIINNYYKEKGASNHEG